MQKAYISCTTSISLPNDKVSLPFLVHQIAQEHDDLMSEMSQGKFYDNIEQDPRDDDTLGKNQWIDLKSLPEKQEGPIKIVPSSINRIRVGDRISWNRATNYREDFF